MGARFHRLGPFRLLQAPQGGELSAALGPGINSPHSRLVGIQWELSHSFGHMLLSCPPGEIRDRPGAHCLCSHALSKGSAAGSRGTAAERGRRWSVRLGRYRREPADRRLPRRAGKAAPQSVCCFPCERAEPRKSLSVNERVRGAAPGLGGRHPYADFGRASVPRRRGLRRCGAARRFQPPRWTRTDPGSGKVSIRKSSWLQSEKTR